MKRVKIDSLPKAQNGIDWEGLSNLELARRARAAGWDNVDQYRNAKWAYNTTPAGTPKADLPKFPTRIGPTKEAAVLDTKQKEEAKRRYEQQALRGSYPNDPAGLPSVPIFEAALMAPVALGQAGLSGLLGTEILGTGVTAGNIANPLFATHGVYNFANPNSDFRQALSRYTSGSGDWRDVAFEGGLNALNFLGAKAIPGDIKALSNARAPQLYKYNPWAWKPNPEAYYHRSPNLKNIINLENGTLQGFGQSAEGKLFSQTKDYFPGTKLNLRKPANSRLYFSKGVPLDYGRYNPETFNEAGKRIMTGQGYEGPYMVEVEGVPMGASVKGRAPSANPPTGLEGYAVSHRPIGLPEAKFYKEHWLKGYKPVDIDKEYDLTSLYRIEPKGKTFPSFANPYDPGYLDWSMSFDELQKDPSLAKLLLDDPKSWATVDWGEVTGGAANGDRRIAQYYPQSAEGNWWSTDHPTVRNHMFDLGENEALQMMEVKVPKKILPQYQSLAVSPTYGNPRPDEFILPSDWRKGAKITDWEPPKKAQGGDISIPDLRRVKISKLAKAQYGEAVENMVNYINQKFGWNNQEPQQSSLDYFYNMAKLKPQSGFNYNTYMNHANKYLNRDTFKGTTLTAKDLADAAQEFYNSTKYVYPIDLLLAQGQMETKLGKTLKSQHNYFNVGNTDEGAVRNFKSGKDSALNYMNLMYNDYMNKGQKTPEQLLSPNSFVNYAGKRYASNPNYEKEVGDQRAFIKKYLGIQKEGGSLPKAQDGTFDYFTAAKKLHDEKNRINQMRNQIIPIAISHDATSDNRPFHVHLPEDQPYCTTRACEAEREAGFPVKQVASGYKLMKELTPEQGWYPTSYDQLLPGDMTQVVRNSGFGHTMISTGDVSNMPDQWRGNADPSQKGFYWDNGSGQDFQFASPKSEDQLARWMDNVKRMNYYTYKGNLPQYEKEYSSAVNNYLHDTSEGDAGPMAPIDAIPHKKQGGAVKRVKIKGLPKNWKTK